MKPLLSVLLDRIHKFSLIRLEGAFVDDNDAPTLTQFLKTMKDWVIKHWLRLQSGCPILCNFSSYQQFEEKCRFVDLDGTANALYVELVRSCQHCGDLYALLFVVFSPSLQKVFHHYKVNIRKDADWTLLVTDFIDYLSQLTGDIPSAEVVVRRTRNRFTTSMRTVVAPHSDKVMAQYVDHIKGQHGISRELLQDMPPSQTMNEARERISPVFGVHITKQF